MYFPGGKAMYRVGRYVKVAQVEMKWLGTQDEYKGSNAGLIQGAWAPMYNRDFGDAPR